MKCKLAPETARYCSPGPLGWHACCGSPPASLRGQQWAIGLGRVMQSRQRPKCCPGSQLQRPAGWTLPMELMHHLPGLHRRFFLPKDDDREGASLEMSSDKKLGQALQEFAKQWDVFLSRVQFACCWQKRGKLLKEIKNTSNTTKPLKPSVFRKMSCSHLHHPAVTVSHVWSHLAMVHTGSQEQGFSVFLYQVTPWRRAFSTFWGIFFPPVFFPSSFKPFPENHSSFTEGTATPEQWKGGKAPCETHLLPSCQVSPILFGMAPKKALELIFQLHLQS